MIEFLLQLLEIDSTTGQEERLANYLLARHKPEGATVEIQTIPSSKKNILFKWGNPKIVFCTHLDTVPPYLPSRRDGGIVYGRGAVDAKGQIAVMYEACKNLFRQKCTNFGLLLVAGEEVGTYGAKEARELIKNARYIIIGEPSQNKLIKATKGTFIIEFAIKGRAAHSGYSKLGSDAIETTRIFLNKLKKLKFPIDKLLGNTTYNIGLLNSPNAYNVTADKVIGKILFRTTFETHHLIPDMLMSIVNKDIHLNFVHNDLPLRFHCVEGFETDIASFGSDAPKFASLGKCLLYGAGSILQAHTQEENVKIAELKQAVEDLEKIFKLLRVV